MANPSIMWDISIFPTSSPLYFIIQFTAYVFKSQDPVFAGHACVEGDGTIMASASTPQALVLQKMVVDDAMRFRCCMNCPGLLYAYPRAWRRHPTADSLSSVAPPIVHVAAGRVRRAYVPRTCLVTSRASASLFSRLSMGTMFVFPHRSMLRSLNCLSRGSASHSFFLLPFRSRAYACRLNLMSATFSFKWVAMCP